MELEPLRCTVRRLESVLVVRPTYVLFSLEIQSPKGHLNIYKTFVLSRSSLEGEELLEMINLVWFGLILWHINHWRLFNAKSIFIHINNYNSNN